MKHLNRRSFLRIAGISAGAAMAGPLPAIDTRKRPTPAGGASDIVVVGAGAFGGWTALCLQEMGHRVTLLDAYGTANPRSSSGCETRQITAGYANGREIYTRWALASLERWKQRQAEWGQELLLETGRLLLAAEWNSKVDTIKAGLDRAGLANEIWKPDEIARRYPQVSLDGISAGVWEPSTGVIKSRQACEAVSAAFVRAGGKIATAHARPGTRNGGRLSGVALGDGSELGAQTFVFACGPWLPKVFPELMAKKLFTPRRDVFFFGTPPGDARFTHPNFPAFSESTYGKHRTTSIGYYGFPSIDGNGFKVMPTGELTSFDPDADERVVSAYQIHRAKEYVSKRFPALRSQPIVATRVCQTEMSIDEHFIIDRHPELENVWIAGGGSGHGFKHGPMVGEYVAKRVTGADTDPALAPVFRLKDETF